SLGNVMKKSKIIPIMLSNMVSVSEQSGSLPETLNNISQDYETEMDEIVKSLMVLVEPAIILILGGIVGFIVIALLLPIFSIDILGGA
ncbi:MAG: type II secretion system F family protein, partial [Candidatus Omnitrophica bacterium]|nr:type II secretion system F family protein [Candidatus Omnitrophota bacterium]